MNLLAPMLSSSAVVRDGRLMLLSPPRSLPVVCGLGKGLVKMERLDSSVVHLLVAGWSRGGLVSASRLPRALVVVVSFAVGVRVDVDVLDGCSVGVVVGG